MARRDSLAVLRERDFALVFGAQVVSLLGDGIVPVALAFAVLDLTESATDLGLVLAARMVPLVGSLLAGGVVADRVSRRAVMVVADLVRFAMQAVLGLLLVFGHPPIWQIAALQAVLGAASGFFNPAASGLIPTVVSPGHLQEANALRGVAMAVGTVVGPALAGVLVATIGAGESLLLDAGSYAASAALLARVHAPAAARRAPSSFLADLREGWREVRSRTWVWGVIVAFGVVNMVTAAFTVLGPLIARRDLGGAGAWGAVLAAGGAGQVAGGLVSLRARPRRPLLMAVLASELAVVPTLLLALGAPVAPIAAGAAFGGVGAMLFNTLWETTLARNIPREVLSRVTAYDWFGSLVFQPIGLAVVGPVAAGLGVTTTLCAAAIAETVAIGALLAVRDVRTIGAVPAPTA
jgi:predicted MFS family arabinose efflux permease